MSSDAALVSSAHAATMERDRAYEQVRQAIVSGQLGAGAAVSERGLSEALQWLYGEIERK